MRAVLTGLSLAAMITAEVYSAASPLKLFVSLSGAVAPVYIAMPTPPADLVVLVNEPLTIRVEVINDGDVPRALIAKDRNVGIALRTFPERRLLNRPSRPTTGPPTRVFGRDESATVWNERMPLAARERLKWIADLSGDAIPPGIYSIEGIVSASDEDGNPVVSHAPRVMVEIRDDKSENAAQELALRNASRLLVANRLLEAIDAARAMVTQYPNSAIGHSVLGDAYAAIGNAPEAARSHSQALRIVETNSDVPLLSRRTPEQMQELAFILKSKIAREQ